MACVVSVGIALFLLFALLDATEPLLWRAGDPTSGPYLGASYSYATFGS